MYASYLISYWCPLSKSRNPYLKKKEKVSAQYMLVFDVYDTIDGQSPNLQPYMRVLGCLIKPYAVFVMVANLDLFSRNLTKLHSISFER